MLQFMGSQSRTRLSDLTELNLPLKRYQLRLANISSFFWWEIFQIFCSLNVVYQIHFRNAKLTSSLEIFSSFSLEIYIISLLKDNNLNLTLFETIYAKTSLVVGLPLNHYVVCIL